MNHEVNGITYNIGKLGVFDQLKVVRRLAPVLSGVREAFKQSKPTMVPDGLDSTKVVPVITLDNLEVAPLATALSDMRDEDVEAIVKVCLKAVRRKQEGTGFVPIIDAASGMFMFDDMDLSITLNLSFQVKISRVSATTKSSDSPTQ